MFLLSNRINQKVLEIMNDSLQQFKAEFFKVLAHPVRIRLCELLREREKNVSELQSELGLDQSTVSQHLSMLRQKGFLMTRKVGTTVFYCIREPLVFDLLDVARAIFNNHLLQTQDLLEQLAQEDDPTNLRIPKVSTGIRS